MRCSHNAKIRLGNAGALTTRCQRAVNTRDVSIITMGDIYRTVYLDSEKKRFLEAERNRSFAIASGRRRRPCYSASSGFGKSLIYQTQTQCECSNDFAAQQHNRGTSRGTDQARPSCRSFEGERSTMHGRYFATKVPLHFLFCGFMSVKRISRSARN